MAPHPYRFHSNISGEFMTLRTMLNSVIDFRENIFCVTFDFLFSINNFHDAKNWLKSNFSLDIFNFFSRIKAPLYSGWHSKFTGKWSRYVQREILSDDRKCGSACIPLLLFTVLTRHNLGIWKNNNYVCLWMPQIYYISIFNSLPLLFTFIA